MKLTVNDTELQVGDGTTVAALLGRLGYPDKGIAVIPQEIVELLPTVSIAKLWVLLREGLPRIGAGSPRVVVLHRVCLLL